MKKINIYGWEFSVPELSFVFLNNYLERIKKYLEKNNLDNDLSSDIEERISEKFRSIVDSWNEIIEKNVIDIVNEIWEPEDIFVDMKNISWDSLKSKFRIWFHRNSKKWIIFWVCAWLGEHFDIDPIWIRIVFFIFCLFYWTGVLVYFLLAIFLPDIDDEEINYDKNIDRMKQRIIELSNKSFFERFIIKLRFFIISFINATFRIIVFLLFSFCGIFLFFNWLGILIFGGLINSDFIFDNQRIFAYMPIYTQISIISLWVILFLVGISSFLFSLKIKLFNKYIFIVLLTGLSLCMVFLSNWAFKIISKYSNSYDFLQTATLQESQSWKILQIEFLGNNLNMNHFFDWAPRISFGISKDDRISFEVKSSIRSNAPEEAEKIFTELNQIVFKILDNKIQIIKPNNNFKKIVPFSFLQRNITIKIPNNIKIDTSNLSRRIFYIDYSNIESSEEMKKYELNNCNWQIIEVDSVKNFLFCNDLEAIKIAKRDLFVKDNIYEFLKKKTWLEKLYYRYNWLDENNIEANYYFEDKNEILNIWLTSSWGQFYFK